MTLLKRKIDSFLEEWKADPERLPLIVKGARQKDGYRKPITGYL